MDDQKQPVGTTVPAVDTHDNAPAVQTPVAEQPVADVPVAEEQPPVVRAPRPPSTNTQQDSEVYAPLAKAVTENDVLLSLPPDSQANIAAALDAMPNINLTETREGDEWLNNLRASTYSVPFRDYFAATLARPNAAYRQTVPSERGPLAAGAPRFNDNTTKLTGERAVLRIRALTGLGSVVRIPLWHSGFWISIKAPGDGALLELNRRLAEEKITLGRATYGLAFANNSVLYAGWLMDFALAHIYDSSLKTELQPSMRERISSLDIPIIAWGLACVIWPGGFPYARSVLSPDGESQKVIKEKLLVGKLMFTDTSSLSQWQISHMASNHGSTMTAEMLERYRAEFTRGKGRTIDLTPNLKVTLRNPSMDQYLTSGMKWVNGIVNMVDRALGMPPSDGVRDNYILDQGKATNMRQYSHFVESIDADGQLIDDAETLEASFDALSSNDDIRDTFFKAVRDFVEDATVSVIAIPVTEEGEKSELPRFPHLLAIDPLSVFFILLVQKIPQIQAR